MTGPFIVSIGEVLFDVLPDGWQLGGAPANFAYHAGKLGATSRLISATGDDGLGAEIRRLLTEKGCSTALIQTSGYPSSTVDAVLDSLGAATYTIHQPVAWDELRWTPELGALVRGAQAVCFGTLAQRSVQSRETIRQLLASAPEDDCVFVCDLNLRWPYYTKDIIEESLHVADVVKLNEEELVVLAGLFGWRGSEGTLLEELMRLFQLQLVVLTAGSAYSVLLTPHEESRLETPKVAVKDTIGAGDSFTAAVVMGRLKGWALGEVHRKAVELAAFVCTQEGGMPAYQAG